MKFIKFVPRVTIQDILMNGDYWRALLYDKKVLIFRELKLSAQEFINIHKVFGRPWSAPLYTLSRELPNTLSSGDVYTTYSNVLMKKSIGNNAMSFHRDIPWHRAIRYPIRSLYPTVLPSTKNSTLFIDANSIWDQITEQRAQELERTNLTIQSWYEVALDTGKHLRKSIPLVEIHPFTKRKTCLLNATGRTAWVQGIERDNCAYDHREIDQLIDLAKSEVYEHDWRLGDLVLFDNYSGVMHGRNQIPHEPREFWRINVKHGWQL